MSDNPVRDFFDALAPRWDEGCEDGTPHIEELLSRLDIKPGSKVLDLACGTGIISGLLRDKFGAVVTGLDLSPKMIAIAKKKYEGWSDITFKAGDFLAGGLEDKYDWVVCHNAFPHFVDVDAFIESLYGSLNEKGEFVVFHSIGRERLSHHHEGLSSSISRDLGPVEEESKAFLRRFQVVEADESPTHYWIRGRK